jgi:acetyltransferase
MEAIIAHSKDKKLHQLQGMTMPSNKGMVTLAKKLGFEIQVDFEEGVVDMTLSL